MNEKTQQALEKVIEELKAMPPGEFQALLEQHRNSDIAVAIHELNEFGDTMEANYMRIVETYIEPHLHFLYGSQQYGTADSESDSDLVIIVPDVDAWYSSIPHADRRTIDVHFSVSVYTRQQFQNKLDVHDVVTIECFMADQVKAIDAGFTFVVEPWKIRSMFAMTASNSWVKAKKKLTVPESYDEYIAKKSAFHALRILMFGIQLLEHGKIVNWQQANKFYQPIMECKTWDEIHEKYHAGYNALRSKLRLLAPKGE